MGYRNCFSEKKLLTISQAYAIIYKVMKMIFIAKGIYFDTERFELRETYIAPEQVLRWRKENEVVYADRILPRFAPFGMEVSVFTTKTENCRLMHEFWHFYGAQKKLYFWASDRVFADGALLSGGIKANVVYDNQGFTDQLIVGLNFGNLYPVFAGVRGMFCIAQTYCLDITGKDFLTVAVPWRFAGVSFESCANVTAEEAQTLKERLQSIQIKHDFAKRNVIGVDRRKRLLYDTLL